VPGTGFQADEHQLVAPNILRSRALALVYREFRQGELDADPARAILDGITTLRIRLLGDRVSRAAAWRVAAQLDWDDIADAEYVAVAQLQADEFITLNSGPCASGGRSRHDRTVQGARALR